MAEDFRSLQRRFAAHLRDPHRQPLPDGLEDRRVGIYRDLFLNNLIGLLEGGFPVLRSLYDTDSWRILVQRWFAEHRAQTPLFPQLGREFVSWLKHTCETNAEPMLPLWQAELAHYEWMEVVASHDEREIDAIAHDPEGDLLEGRPVLSPLVWPLEYRFAVHRIRPDARPDGAAPEQASHLLIVRNRHHQVRFLEANAWTLRLLEHLRRNDSANGRAMLTTIAHESGLDAQAVIAAGTALLDRLRRHDVVLGTDLAAPSCKNTHR